MMETRVLYSGGAPGSEAAFGRNAELYGIAEVNFSFEGHQTERPRGLRVLTQDELQQGDVSLSYVSRLMKRRYSEGPMMRRILQTIWHQVNHGQEIFVVGKVLENGTVKGGTGWGAEFAKLCNKTLHVFDQELNTWFSWDDSNWVERDLDDEPLITVAHFCGTGTRHLNENGVRAVADLFVRSYGEPPVPIRSSREMALS